MQNNISKKIENYLLEIILSNKNKNLPSENFLATKFKTTRQTARTELTKLLNKGFIRVRKGSGYFINPHINHIKLFSVGNNYKWNEREVYEISDEYFLKIIEKCSIATKLNPQEYFGYRKVFYNDNSEVDIYINSYILKTDLNSIDTNKICKSLVNFFNENNIKIDYQINNAEIEAENLEDKKIFKVSQVVTPTIYGMTVSKDGNIIEVFERRHTLDKFKPSFIKQF